MKTTLLTMLALSLLITPSLFAQTSDSTKQITKQYQKFDPARDAQKDIQNAIVLAKKSNKRILLDIGGEWCIWCRRLDSLFAQNKHLVEYRDKYYILVKINVSKENKNEEVLAKYPKVAGYPHLFVLDKTGKSLHSQDTGELEYPKGNPNKGHDKEKVIAFLKKWRDS